MKKDDITGVLLAGGKNSRMGYDKGMLMVNGEKIYEKIIGAMKPLVKEIVIVSNGNNYNNLGYKVFPDVIKNCGPMGGIFTALSFSTTEKILVTACDMPFLNSFVLKKLIDNSCNSEITVPEIDNNLQPLCAVYSVNCSNRFSRLLAEKKWKMKEALIHFNTKRVKLSGDYFQNINTPEEYNNIKDANHEYSR